MEDLVVSEGGRERVGPAGGVGDEQVHRAAGAQQSQGRPAAVAQQAGQDKNLGAVRPAPGLVLVLVGAALHGDDRRETQEAGAEGEASLRCVARAVTTGQNE